MGKGGTRQPRGGARQARASSVSKPRDARARDRRLRARFESIEPRLAHGGAGYEERGLTGAREVPRAGVHAGRARVSSQGERQFAPVRVHGALRRGVRRGDERDRERDRE